MHPPERVISAEVSYSLTPKDRISRAITGFISVFGPGIPRKNVNFLNTRERGKDANMKIVKNKV